MATETVEVAILGAGIAGCALAHHLCELHVGPNLVCDPRTPAAGASGRAAGIVTEQLWNRWDVEVTRESKEEYARLAARWDPTAYATNGFVRWAREATTAEALSAATRRWRDWNVAVEPVDPSELARRVPWGRFDDVQGAVACSSDGVVAPSTMTEIYAESARRSGAIFWLGRPFRPPVPSGESWVLEGADEKVRAKRVVVAAGAWTKRLLREMGRPVPLAPYRTQAALLRPSRPTSALFPSVHDLDTDVYVRPEANGRILAGDGTERREADPETFRPGGDEAFVGRLAECFAERFPGWADAELVRAWAGVCCATPDRRPLVGPLPGREELHILAGFNGFGVMRAGGIAGRLARYLAVGEGEGRERDALEPVLPTRFGAEPIEFEPRPGFTLEGGRDPRF